MKIFIFIGVCFCAFFDKNIRKPSDGSKDYISKYSKQDRNYACDGSATIMLLTNSHQNKPIRVYYTRYNIYSRYTTTLNLVNDVNPQKETFIGCAWNMAFVVDSTKFIR